MKEKGITLIALVITIIVLLILAGITIATLTGQNGILTRAAESKKNTEKAQVEEYVKLAINNSYGESGKIEGDKLKENLEKIPGINKDNLPDNITDADFPLSFEVDNRYEVTIDKDGNTTIIDKNEQNEGNQTTGGNTTNNTTEDLIDPIDDWQFVETLTSPNYRDFHPEFCYDIKEKRFASNVVGIKVQFTEIFIEMDDYDRFDRVVLTDKDNKIVCSRAGRANVTCIVLGNYYQLKLLSDFANSFYGYSCDIYITTNPELVKGVTYLGNGKNNVVQFNNREQKIESYEINFDKKIQSFRAYPYLFYYFDTNVTLEEAQGKYVGTIRMYNENNEKIFEKEYVVNLKQLTGGRVAKGENYSETINNIGNKIRVEIERNTEDNVLSNGTVYWDTITYQQ